MDVEGHKGKGAPFTAVTIYVVPFQVLSLLTSGFNEINGAQGVIILSVSSNQAMRRGWIRMRDLNMGHEIMELVHPNWFNPSQEVI